MKLERAARQRLFWLVCIPFRIGYAALALLLGIHSLHFPLRVQAVVAAAQLFNFIRSLGKTVGGFGGPAWWASMRPFHVAAYAGFVVSGLVGVWWAGVFLAADAVAGAVSWYAVRPAFVSSQPTALPLLQL